MQSTLAIRPLISDWSPISSKEHSWINGNHRREGECGSQGKSFSESILSHAGFVISPRPAPASKFRQRPAFLRSSKSYWRISPLEHARSSGVTKPSSGSSLFNGNSGKQMRDDRSHALISICSLRLRGCHSLQPCTLLRGRTDEEQRLVSLCRGRRGSDGRRGGLLVFRYVVGRMSAARR